MREFYPEKLQGTKHIVHDLEYISCHHSYIITTQWYFYTQPNKENIFINKGKKQFFFFFFCRKYKNGELDFPLLTGM